jgi:hypothetical protein
MLELAAQYKALAEFMKVEFFDAGSVFRPTPWTGSISPPGTMRIWELLSPERLWRYLPHTTPRASRLLLEDPANCQEPGFKDRPRLRPRAHSGVPHGTSPPPWTVSRCNHDRTRRFREEAAGFSIAPRRPVRGEVTHDIGGSEALDSNTSGEGHHRCNSNIHYQRMSVSVVARPGFEPTAFLVRMIASPAARNFPYDMATETTIAVLRA